LGVWLFYDRIAKQWHKAAGITIDFWAKPEALPAFILPLQGEGVGAMLTQPVRLGCSMLAFQAA
jgi:hypothetical protein